MIWSLVGDGAVVVWWLSEGRIEFGLGALCWGIEAVCLCWTLGVSLESSCAALRTSFENGILCKILLMYL